MDEILDLISRYRDLFYLIAFVWAFLEGETFVIFAGLAAWEGLLEFTPLVLAAGFGSFAGDQLWFALGRRHGEKLLSRFPKLQDKMDIALFMAETYTVPFILSFRYLYGIRNVSSAAFGLSSTSWRKFAFWNFIASFIWAFSFAGLGYIFGRIFREAVGDYARYGMIGALVVFIAVLYMVLRRQTRKLEAFRARKRRERILAGLSPGNAPPPGSEGT